MENKNMEIMDPIRKIVKVKNSKSDNLINNLQYYTKKITLEKLLEQIGKLRKNKKIVQCHGVFDLLHIGHIKHFEEAKTFGDILIVTVTCDSYVNKGNDRPYFSEHLRADAIAALSCVDYVVINYHPTSVPILKLIQPDYYVKGIEYQDSNNDLTGKILEEEEIVKSFGGELKFTNGIVFSSSALLNRFFPTLPAYVVNYLNNFKKKYNETDILKYLHGASDLNILLIGEAIIDIYHFGEAIGKAGKEPVLVTKYHREESYIGGVLAVANHLSSFCKKVTCITMLGENGQYESFIRDKLSKNVEIIFHYKKNAPTIVKRRYLEEYSSQKLFEIYEIDDAYLEENERDEFINSVENQIDNHEVVIVTDYGHGLLDDICIKKIEDNAKFLAINAQSNAGNHGFNCISKYKKADYVCIATRELQLNYRQKHISVFEQVKKLVQDYQYKNVMITNGRSGSFSYNINEGIFEIPAFTSTVKDRVGAGDAVLAITSLCVAQKAPAELVGFIGNVVGSQAVNIMGNQSFIEKISLMKYVLHLMK